MNIKILNNIFECIIVLIIIVFIIRIILKSKKNKLKKEEKSLIKVNLTTRILQQFSKIKNARKCFYIIIFSLAIFTRIYKIDTLLNGLHVDETGMGYDAFCIANYGVDRYLNKFPVYMINFGGGQSALYTYLAAIFVKILGLNIISIRIPGIILSLLAILSGFILIKKTYGIKSGILFMCLMIVCPWHVMQSRFGLDCNLLSSMIIISTTLLVISKKWWQYLITGISFGITLYTYALSYIIVPILLFLSLIYMLYIKKIKFTNIIILGIPIAIFAFPLILMILVNLGYLNQIDWIITIPKLFSYRGNEINFNNILSNLSIFKDIIKSDGFIYNSIPEFGTIYLFTIPLALSGMVVAIIETIKSIKNKKFNISAIMLFLFIANIILMSLTTVNVNKINSIYISLLYFIFVMLKNIYKYFKIGFWVIILIYLIMSIIFFKYYYNDYNIKHSSIGLVDNEVVDIIQKIEELDNEKNVYLHLNIREPWIYALYSLQMSPYEFNETKHENWNETFSFGKYYFELPDEIIDDSIYVINQDNTTEEFVKELIENNYKIEQYKTYTIYY